MLSESGGNQGIGLAIPSNLALSIQKQLAQTGKVTRGWLGVVVDPLTGDVADQLGLGNQGGVVVTGLYQNAPAASIPWSERGTDIILSANGAPVDSPGELRNLIAGLAPGAALKLHVWSNGQTKDYSVNVGTRPARAQGV
ncbi:MAG: PDZ domain-containing protein [Cytophagaceae bacterium]|nr:MAG: PDZ domain-containing protein [Cytophagaceae bacterium]